MFELLSFLASEGGRTDANCRLVGSFVRELGDRLDVEWEEVLPVRLAGVVEDMGMQLDDTVSAPEIAAEFDSLPEQLLRRLQAD